MSIFDLIPWGRGTEKKMPVRQTEKDPFLALQQDMNSLFDEFTGRFNLAPFSDFGNFGTTFQPRLNVSEGDKDIKVSAELPGLTEQDIEITLSGDRLTISGEKKVEKEDKRDNYYRKECSYGSFQRVIALPCEIEENKIDAVFKNGVLNISLPKTAQACQEKKRIAVKSR